MTKFLISIRILTSFFYTDCIQSYLAIILLTNEKMSLYNLLIHKTQLNGILGDNKCIVVSIPKKCLATSAEGTSYS